MTPFLPMKWKDADFAGGFQWKNIPAEVLAKLLSFFHYDTL